MTTYVYDFSEGGRDMADLLGGKGANLAEMARMRLPVPPGFTVTTEACRIFLATGQPPDGLDRQIGEHLAALERAAGKRLGQVDDPLLLSVRSGARFSMPGMMETILDVGLNDLSVLGLAKTPERERFAWDSYRRLVQMFGSTVMGVDSAHFEAALATVRANADTPEDAARARRFGAQGIGLCRTEHMFLGDRRPLVEAMILAHGDTEREAALAALLPLQRQDFTGILEAMDGLPVTVRSWTRYPPRLPGWARVALGEGPWSLVSPGPQALSARLTGAGRRAPPASSTLAGDTADADHQQ
ncbi:hypothetical protein OG373_37605 [Streptomyces avidinii]|uniref:PEP/pyruvate-binding domain-containing protein n=1 Tax=Streptomyces avidinii TaxID=1895 RepID=UPI003863A1D7|nr:hypothetical protein OG373_37605 [Streptomyces avidinii]